MRIFSDFKHPCLSFLKNGAKSIRQNFNLFFFLPLGLDFLFESFLGSQNMKQAAKQK
jgi:hypothetical protein